MTPPPGDRRCRRLILRYGSSLSLLAIQQGFFISGAGAVVLRAPAWTKAGVLAVAAHSPVLSPASPEFDLSAVVPGGSMPAIRAVSMGGGLLGRPVSRLHVSAGGPGEEVSFPGRKKILPPTASRLADLNQRLTQSQSPVTILAATFDGPSEPSAASAEIPAAQRVRELLAESGVQRESALDALDDVDYFLANHAYGDAPLQGPRDFIHLVPPQPDAATLADVGLLDGYKKRILAEAPRDSNGQPAYFLQQAADGSFALLQRPLEWGLARYEMGQPDYSRPSVLAWQHAQAPRLIEKYGTERFPLRLVPFAASGRFFDRWSAELRRQRDAARAEWAIRALDEQLRGLEERRQAAMKNELLSEMHEAVHGTEGGKQP